MVTFRAKNTAQVLSCWLNFVQDRAYLVTKRTGHSITVLITTIKSFIVEGL
jgi:hypothetical protein